MVGGVRGADHRGERAFEGAQDLAHRDVGRRPGQLVAAVRPTRGGDQSGVAEDERQLLQVRPRQVLGRGDLRQRSWTLTVVSSELHHQPDAVLALRAEGDGAGAVEAWSRGRRGVRQGSILNPDSNGRD